MRSWFCFYRGFEIENRAGRYFRISVFLKWFSVFSVLNKYRDYSVISSNRPSLDKRQAINYFLNLYHTVDPFDWKAVCNSSQKTNECNFPTSLCVPWVIHRCNQISHLIFQEGKKPFHLNHVILLYLKYTTYTSEPNNVHCTPWSNKYHRGLSLWWLNLLALDT